MYQNMSHISESSHPERLDGRRITTRPNRRLTESEHLVIGPRDDAAGRSARAELRPPPARECRSRCGRNRRRDEYRGMRLWLQGCGHRPPKVPLRALPDAPYATYYHLSPDSCDNASGILSGSGEPSASAASPRCLVFVGNAFRTVRSRKGRLAIRSVRQR